MNKGITSCVVLVALVAATCTCMDGCRGRPEGNYFDGELELRAVGPGRMELLKPFAYIDGEGETWTVPVGRITDGASIPQVFWSVVGSPFTGNYLRAAVVHDRYCEDEVGPWREVHRMFYEACLCAGVSDTKARLLYAAVYHFGPRWPDPGRADAEVAFSAPVVEALARSEGIPTGVSLENPTYRPEMRQITFRANEVNLRATRDQARTKQQEFIAALGRSLERRPDVEVATDLERVSRIDELPVNDSRALLGRIETRVESVNDPRLTEQFEQFVQARQQLQAANVMEARILETQERLFEDIKRYVERESPSLEEIERYPFE